MLVNSNFQSDSPFDAPNWRAAETQIIKGSLFVGSQSQVMQDWEQPLMRRLAQFATLQGGRVLEVGFGLGISAAEIMNCGCEEYVVIEAHPEIAARARTWGAQQRIPVRIFEGFWQNVIHEVGRFDGVLFDVYAVNDISGDNNYRRFLPLAHQVLRPNGGVTYFSGETRKFDSDHIEFLLSHFGEVNFAIVDGLYPPPECRYWKHDHMVVPYVKRPLVGLANSN